MGNNITFAINARHAQSETTQAHYRRKLQNECTGAPIVYILKKFSDAINAHGGSWANVKETAHNPAKIEIRMHGAIGAGHTSAQACRDWLRNARECAAKA